MGGSQLLVVSVAALAVGVVANGVALFLLWRWASPKVRLLIFRKPLDGCPCNDAAGRGCYDVTELAVDELSIRSWPRCHGDAGTGLETRGKIDLSQVILKHRRPSVCESRLSEGDLVQRDCEIAGVGDLNRRHDTVDAGQNDAVVPNTNADRVAPHGPEGVEHAQRRAYDGDSEGYPGHPVHAREHTRAGATGEALAAVGCWIAIPLLTLAFLVTTFGTEWLLVGGAA